MLRKSSTIDRRTARIDGYTVPYIVRRHARANSMRLQVTPFDGVVVTLPLRLPRYVNPDIFVRENGAWVLTKLREIGRTPDREGRSNKALRSGSTIKYRGNVVRVVSERLSVSAPHVVFNQQAGALSVYLPIDSEQSLNDVVREWLQQQATKKILAVAHAEARRIGVRFRKISIRGQKTKWGSCNAQGDLTFNWRLILFPPSILRYVVIHELCHLRHFDHSLRFWKTVMRYMPEYRRAVDWLRREGMDARNLLVDL